VLFVVICVPSLIYSVGVCKERR